MKATGVVRKLDELGRVVIPKELRTTLGWEEKQPLEFFVDGPNVIMKGYRKDVERNEALDKLEAVIGELDNEVAKQQLNEVIEFLVKG